MVLQLVIFVVGLFVIYKLASAASGGMLNLFAGGGRHFSSKELSGLQDSFFKTVFSLLGYVARRDGRVNEKEIKRTETFMEKMGLDAEHKREAIQLFKKGAESHFDVKQVLHDFHPLAHKSPNLTQILLVYLINLARVDGELSNKEVDAVKEVASGLGYSSITFQHLLKMVSSQNKFNDDPIGMGDAAQQQGESASKANEYNQQQSYRFKDEEERSGCAYEALGLTANASDAEVKKAYRTLANQYHPDKIISQGLPPFMVEDAIERFKKIQGAYDCIKKSRR